MVDVENADFMCYPCFAICILVFQIHRMLPVRSARAIVLSDFGVIFVPESMKNLKLDWLINPVESTEELKKIEKCGM